MARNIVIIGDSLSAAYGIPRETGWVALLSQRLQTIAPTYQTVNLSVSGETTQGGVQRLPAALQRYQPSIVIIELGANDGLRGFDLDTTRKNLHQMIQSAQQTGAKVLLLGMRLPMNYGPVYRAKFQQIYTDLAMPESVALVDFLLAGVAQNPDKMQADGIHPNEAAQPCLLQNVWPKLQPLL